MPPREKLDMQIHIVDLKCRLDAIKRDILFFKFNEVFEQIADRIATIEADLDEMYKLTEELEK